uniref:Solute carrier family 16 member 2 n=1 Tax=Eptatretus burgeri TaxID=7764 RepID=A0A8C4WZT9_EPTBU
MERDLDGEQLLTSRLEGEENEEDMSKETGNEIDYSIMEQNELRGNKDLARREGDDEDEDHIEIESGTREHHGAAEYQGLNENLGEGKYNESEDPDRGEVKRMREIVGVGGCREGHVDPSESDGLKGHVDPSVSDSPKGHVDPSDSDGPKGHVDSSVSDSPKGHVDPSVSDSPKGHVDFSESDGPKGHVDLSVSDGPKGHVDPSESDGPKGHVDLSVSDGPKGHVDPSESDGPKGHVDHSTSEEEHRTSSEVQESNEELGENTCLVMSDGHIAREDFTAGGVQNLRDDRDASQNQVKDQIIEVDMSHGGIEQDDDDDDDCQIAKEMKKEIDEEDDDFNNGESEKLTSKMRSNEEIDHPGECEGETFQEGGWGWVVMMAALWANGSIFGIQNSFGMLFILIQQELGDAEDPNLQFKTAWVGGLAMGVIFGGSPLVAMTTDRFGPRMTATVGSSVAFLGLLCSAFARSLPVLYVTYSLIFACGASFAYQPSLVILGRYFRRRLGLVNGLVTAGSSGFSIALPFLIRACSPRGLSFTLQILSIFIVVLIFASLSYRPPAQHFQPLTHPLAVSRPRTTSEITSKESSKSCAGCLASFRAPKQFKRSDFKCTCEFVKPFKFLGFRLWAFGVPLALCGYFVPYVHLVLSFVVIGLVSMLVPLCRTFSELICSVLLMGGADGAFISIMAPIAFELVGQVTAGQAIGAMLGIMAIPMTAGPPIAGMLRDKLGSYDLAFYLAGVPPLLGAAVLASIPRLATVGLRQKTRESRTEMSKKDDEESLSCV